MPKLSPAQRRVLHNLSAVSQRSAYGLAYYLTPMRFRGPPGSIRGAVGSIARTLAVLERRDLVQKAPMAHASPDVPYEITPAGRAALEDE